MKLSKFFASVMMMAVLLAPSYVGAYDQLYDSGCTANSQGWISANRPSGLVHFFKPTHNHLTKLQVVVNVVQVGDFTLKIQKTGTQSISYSKTISPKSTGTTYIMLEDFDFYVVKGANYYVQLNMVGGGNIGWHYTGNTSCDPTGYASWDYKDQPADMWVYLWGYNSVPPADPVDADEKTDNDSDATDTEQVSTPTEEEKASVKGEIAMPVLVKVMEGDQTLTPTEDMKVDATAGDILELSGTAPKGSIVRGIFNEEDILASSEPNGNWMLNADTSGLAPGNYEVALLAEKDGKQSKKVVVLTVAVAEPTAVVAKDATNFFEDNLLYFMIGGGVLVLGLGGLLGYLIYKRKKNEPKANKAAKTPEATETPEKE